MGPGWIAHRFALALQTHTGQKVVAVASRSADRAEAFARERSIDTAYGSYDALLADDDVDIVYVATPHTEHHACALAALAAGKHVLVEKPLGVDAAQAREIGEAARDANLFAGEAMWSRFLPKYDVLQQILDSGVLGTVHTVLADHGEHFTTDHRIYDPALAGGPLLDLGTYVASLSYLVLGAPTSVVAVGQAANDRINGQVSALLTSASGAHSVLNTTILTDTPNSASICGTDATLVVPGTFYMPGPMQLIHRDGPTLEYSEDRSGHLAGLHFSAVDAARTIANGGIESAVHTVSDAVATLAIVDEIRAQLGITFA